MTTLNDVLDIQNKYNILTAPTIQPHKAQIKAAATNSTLNIAIQNNSQSSNVWAYVTGLDINQNNRVFLLQSDGVTAYHPENPGADQTPLAADCAISLGGPGSSKTVTIPQIVGGRIWLVQDNKLTFLLNRNGPGNGPALVEPASNASGDPNYYFHWSFAELTFNTFQAFANITYVDFIGPPVSLGLVSEDGNQQIVPGLPAGGLDGICRELEAQNSRDNAGWNRLIVKGRSGENLRALAPNKAMVLDGNLLRDYYAPYVDRVWAKYSTETLNLNTQVQWGLVKGNVRDGNLVFGDIGAIPKPTSGDIFSCSTGAFADYPGQNKDELGNIVARLAAAFNRSTLLTNPNQPDGENVSNYYRDSVTNHYSRIVHAAHPDGKGYTFPYDDVAPNDGANVAGTVASGNPRVLVVGYGGTVRMGGVGRRESVKLREIARTGGRGSQLVGFGRRVRRGLEFGGVEEMGEIEVNGSGKVDGELNLGTRVVVGRDGEDDEVIDLEKGMLRKLEGEMAWGRRCEVKRESQIEKLVPVAVREKIEALLEKIAESPGYNKYAKPVLEMMGKLLVAILSLSVKTLVSRVVMVLLLVGCSFLLGFFGHGVGAGAGVVGLAGVDGVLGGEVVQAKVGEVGVLRAQGREGEKMEVLGGEEEKVVLKGGEEVEKVVSVEVLVDEVD